MSNNTIQSTQFMQGVACYQQSDYNKAIQQFLSSMTEDLNVDNEFMHDSSHKLKQNCKVILGTFSSFTNLSTCYIKLKQYQKSLKLCHRALERNPYVSLPYYNIASIYIRQQKYHQAIGSVQCAISCEHLRTYEITYDKQFLDKAISLAPNNLQAIKYRIAHNAQLLKFVKQSKSITDKPSSTLNLETFAESKNQILKVAKQLQGDVKVMKKFNEMYELEFQNCRNSISQNQTPNLFITSIKTPLILESNCNLINQEVKLLKLSNEHKLQSLIKLKQLRQEYLNLLKINEQQNDLQSLIVDLSIQQTSTKCSFEIAREDDFIEMNKTNFCEDEKILETSFEFQDACQNNQLEIIRCDQQKRPIFVRNKRKGKNNFEKKLKHRKVGQNIKNKENIYSYQPNNNTNKYVVGDKRNNRDSSSRRISWRDDNDPYESKLQLKYSQKVKRIELNERENLNSSIISILDYEDSHSHEQAHCQNYHHDVSLIQSIMVNTPIDQINYLPKIEQKRPANLSHIRNRSSECLNSNFVQTASKQLSTSQFNSSNLFESKSHHKLLSCSKCSIDHENQEGKPKNMQLKLNLTEIYNYQGDYTQLQTYCIIRHQEQQYRTELSKGRFPNWKEPIQMHVNHLASLNDQTMSNYQQCGSENTKLKIQLWAKPLHYKKDPKVSQINLMHELIGEQQIDLRQSKWIKQKIVLQSHLLQRQKRKTAYMYITLEKIKQ